MPLRQLRHVVIADRQNAPRPRQSRALDGPQPIRDEMVEAALRQRSFAGLAGKQKLLRPRSGEERHLRRRDIRRGGREEGVAHDHQRARGDVRVREQFAKDAVGGGVLAPPVGPEKAFAVFEAAQRDAAPRLARRELVFRVWTNHVHAMPARRESGGHFGDVAKCAAHLVGMKPEREENEMTRGVHGESWHPTQRHRATRTAAVPAARTSEIVARLAAVPFARGEPAGRRRASRLAPTAIISVFALICFRG